MGLLGLAGAIGLGLRLWLALHDDGIYWPDEIYQSLEPGHRWVFGYGLQAWEFIDGARNWTFAGLTGIALKVFSIFGLSSPREYLYATKVLFALMGLGTGFGAFRLARALGASELTSACTAAVVCVTAPFVYFSPRAMSETASALPVVWGLALAADAASSKRARLVGVGLLGFAVLLRLQNGVFCAGLVVWLLARKQKREALEAFAVLAGFAVLYGALDWITWGAPFHSAIKYLKFNLIEGRATQWGHSPPLYYVRVLFLAMPLVTVPLLALWALSARRQTGLFAVSFAFFLLHSLTPHKELRFILPVLPVICALAAVGLETLREPPRQLLMAALLVGSLISAGKLRELTFGQVGQYEKERPADSALDDGGAVNRMLLAAYKRPDLCGLKVEATHMAWAGGYTYLHRDVPLYSSFGPGRESGFFNYVVTPLTAIAGGQIVARDAGVALVRLSPGPCAKDPSFSTRLP